MSPYKKVGKSDLVTLPIGHVEDAYIHDDILAVDIPVIPYDQWYYWIKVQSMVPFWFNGFKDNINLRWYSFEGYGENWVLWVRMEDGYGGS